MHKAIFGAHKHKSAARRKGAPYKVTKVEAAFVLLHHQFSTKCCNVQVRGEERRKKIREEQNWIGSFLQLIIDHSEDSVSTAQQQLAAGRADLQAVDRYVLKLGNSQPRDGLKVAAGT